MSGPAICVFDLDHTLVSSPLDLRLVAREMEAFVRARGVDLPAREFAWSAPELLAFVRREAPHLEAGLLVIPVTHERRAMEEASIEAFALETLAALKQLGFGTVVWTNNDRVASDFVLTRFGLIHHLDLVVTRDDVRHLKPDPDGLAVVRKRWPDAAEIVVVGDSWVDGVAAQAGGVPFIAYRGDRAELARRGVTPAGVIASLGDLPAVLGNSAQRAGRACAGPPSP